MTRPSLNFEANAVIDHLGGATAVARMIEAPLSTVHSWRKIGIPRSRLAHIRIAASASGTPLPDDLIDLAGSAMSRRSASAA